MAVTIQELLLKFSAVSDKATQGIRKLESTLKKLKNATGKTNDELDKSSSAAKRLANAIKNASNKFRGMRTQMDRTTSSVRIFHNANGLAISSMIRLGAKAGVVVLSLKAIYSTMKDAISSANDYIETINLFSVSMGEGAKSAYEFARKASDALGIDPEVWMRYQGTFNTIISGFGVATEKANLMSKQLSQLGYDISSFFNISVDDAMLKLQSGISGELEPLRRLGYDLSVARMQQEAYNLGIEKQVSDMTQAEKAALRYYMIMTQVSVSHTDMARTINSPSNQLRVLTAQLQMAARAIGNLFIPILNKVLPYVTAFVKVVRRAAEEVARFFGIELPTVNYDAASAAFSDMQDFTADIAENTEDTTDNLKDAEKELKKMKKAVLGFDELHQLADNSDALADSLKDAEDALDTSAFEDVFGKIPLPEYDFLEGFVGNQSDSIADAMWNKLKAMEDAIKAFFSDIDAIASIALLGLGIILLIFGGPALLPLAIGLIAAGAIGLATKINGSSAISDEIKGVLDGIMAIAGLAMMAVGLIMAVLGGPATYPVALAMVLAGAALVVSAMVLGNSLSEDVKKKLHDIMKIASGALLAVGILLVAFGGPPLMAIGLGLILIGVVGFVSTAATGSMEDVISGVKTFFSKLAEHLNIIGAVAIALGVLLSVFGMPEFGIPLIAIGVAALVTKAIWKDGVTKDLQTFLAGIATMVGGAFIAIGAILTFTGVATGIGIALLITGFAAMFTGVYLNDGSVISQVEGFFKDFGIWLGTVLVEIGAILIFTGVGTAIGIALVIAGIASTVAGVYLNKDTIISEIVGYLKEFGVAIGSFMMIFGVILIFTGVGTPAGIALLVAGIASTVAGIYLNRDAIMGKIKEFLNYMKEKIKEYGKLALGVVMIFTGIGTPYGVKLIYDWVTTSETSLAMSIKAIWQSIKELLGNVKDKIKEYGKLALGVVLLFTPGANLYGVKMIYDWVTTSETPLAMKAQGLVDTLKEKLNWVKDKLLSFGKLALGVILLFIPGCKEYGFNMIKESGDMGKKLIFTSVEIVKAVESGLNDVHDKFKNIKKKIHDTWDNMIKGLKEKLEGFVPHMKMPHFNWSWSQIGDYLSIPNISVDWYAKGGLFNKATLAGIGEDGTEAVLPLTNKKAMSQIAASITDSGDFMGMDEEAFEEAMVRAFERAQANSADRGDTVVYAELKTDDETLARAVARGNQKLEYRYSW